MEMMTAAAMVTLMAVTLPDRSAAAFSV